MKNTPKILAVTSGEPAGVGPDLCAHLLNFEEARLVVLGDIDLIQSRAKVPCVLFQKENPKPQNALEVLHIPLRTKAEPGVLNVQNAPYVLNLLDCALLNIVKGQFDALVTLPIHKGVICQAGFDFTGHTEYLAQKTAGYPVMMLLGEQKNGAGILRVALATTHLPIQKVPQAITQDLLIRVLSVLLTDLRAKYNIHQPVIKVTGLNPHAGENGHLGKEELETIIPVIQMFQQQGAQVLGPYPADTLFQPTQLKNTDCVLAMYHDQGLAPLKYATFGQGANVTLGLPLIRTSVDHGTALDLAGTQKANPQSLMVAIDQALLMLESSKC